MAGTPGQSGGDRPTAPQNNPANISATGGNGQSGKNSQAPKYIPGMKSLGSTGTETMAQQGAADMYAAPSAPSLPQVTPITAATELPDQNVMDGAPRGPGATTIPGLPTTTDTSSDINRLIGYLPALEAAAAMPNSSESFRNYVRVVRARAQGVNP